MLRVDALAYVQAGELLREIHDLVRPSWFSSNDPISPDALTLIKGVFPNLAAHCKQLRLTVTESHIVDFFSQYKTVNPTRHQTAIFLECVQKSFKAELNSRTFVFILPHRSEYYSDEVKYGAEVQPTLILLEKTFPNACFDFIEAGNCFATERFTASVYHLMRVAEFGLVATADSIAENGAVPGNSRLSWDRLLGSIRGRVKKLESENAEGYKETQRLYGDFCSWFEDIKHGWRNPSSHIPRIYDETTTRGMFGSIRTLFDHLAKAGIKQAHMPDRLIELPIE